MPKFTEKTQVKTDRRTMLSVAVSVFSTGAVLFAVIGYVSFTAVNSGNTTNTSLVNKPGYLPPPVYPPECPTLSGVECRPTATAASELLQEAVAHAIADCTSDASRCVTSEQQEEANFRAQCPSPKCGFSSELRTADCTINRCESLELGGKTFWYCTAVGLQDITNYQCLIQA